MRVTREFVRRAARSANVWRRLASPPARRPARAPSRSDRAQVPDPRPDLARAQVAPHAFKENLPRDPPPLGIGGRPQHLELLVGQGRGAPCTVTVRPLPAPPPWERRA